MNTPALVATVISLRRCPTDVGFGCEPPSPEPPKKPKLLKIVLTIVILGLLSTIFVMPFNSWLLFMGMNTFLFLWWRAFIKNFTHKRKDDDDSIL